MTDGLSGAWDSMSDWRSGELLPGECKTCKLFARCSGGCRVDAEYMSGCRSNLDPYASPDSLDKVILSSDEIVVRDLTNETLKVTDPLYFRQEDFCVLCTSRARIASPVTLSFDTFELLENFKRSKFTVDDVACYTEMGKSESNELCSALISDGVIELV